MIQSKVTKGARAVELQVQQVTNVQRAVAVGLAHGELYDLSLTVSLFGLDDLAVETHVASNLLVVRDEY